MIIDLICDRMDNEVRIANGETHALFAGVNYRGVLYHGEQIVTDNNGLKCTLVPLAYDPKNFYQHVMDYGDIGWGITRAMDAGTNEDVQAALCEYIKKQGYNTELCNYINEREWL